MHVIYRDGGARTERVNFYPGEIGPFLASLSDAPIIRSIECAELLVKSRKSFGADYDPSRWLDALKAATPQPTASAAANHESATDKEGDGG